MICKLLGYFVCSVFSMMSLFQLILFITLLILFYCVIEWHLKSTRRWYDHLDFRQSLIKIQLVNHSNSVKAPAWISLIFLSFIFVIDVCFRMLSQTKCVIFLVSNIRLTIMYLYRISISVCKFVSRFRWIKN